MQQVLQFNKTAIEEKLNHAAAYLGIENGYDGFYDYVGSLNKALNIPANLTELGITNPDIERLVKDALADPSTGGNPIEMTADNTKTLIEACL